MEENSTISEQYIKKVMAGDKEAFAWLYENYYQKVYFFALQFFRKKDIAEDIVHEVFIKVFQKINTLHSPSAFLSWLHVLTYRVCCNYNRSKIILQQFEEESTIDTNAEDVSDQLEKQRVYQIIARLIDEKSLPLRLVGQLSYFEGMKSVEIAKVLGITPVTVRARLKRLRDLLQEDLKKYGITKNSYSFAVISPIILHEAYKILFSESLMNVNVSKKILDTILANNITPNPTIKSLLKKRIYAGTSLVVVSGIAIWGFNQLSQNKEPLPPINIMIENPIKEEIANISNITYDTNWTNKAVEVNVETTNLNYDEITINDIDTREIAGNGTYTIKLLKDGNVIDEKIVNISNIDRYSPTAYSKKDEHNYYFYLSDDLSGVDVKSIQYIKNGIISLDYQYNVDENVLVISNETIAIHEIYISDYAGNIFTITIE